eukprot:scaffold33603_cov75-Phaeocystis_antarctica.AAC.5
MQKSTGVALWANSKPLTASTLALAPKTLESRLAIIRPRKWLLADPHHITNSTRSTGDRSFRRSPLHPIGSAVSGCSSVCRASRSCRTQCSLQASSSL